MTSTIRRGAVGRRAVAAVVAGASLLTVGGLFSGAFFTDSASIDNNDFAFGTVSLSTTPTTKVFSMPAAQPGDVFTGPLTVLNDGSMQLRYALSDVVSSDKIGQGLVLTVKTRTATDATCSAFDGTTLYNGILGLQAGSKILGDKAQGAQTGDRPVDAGATDNLCVRVTAPSTLDNTFQGLTANTVFTFDAEQTDNNP
jgi:spore coat-associated protein N